MSGAFKRSSQCKAGGRWTASYVDEHGRRRHKRGFADKATTLELARKLEAEARLIREGLIDPRTRTARQASVKPIAEHVEVFRDYLVSKGGTTKHAGHVAGALLRLFADSKVARIAEMRLERLQASLSAIRVTKSPRTANHALGCLKSFLRFLHGSGRITEPPGWLVMLHPANEQLGRKRVRRPLTRGELARLFAAAESGAPLRYYGRTKSKHHEYHITGPERAAIYRLAAATGFRANEIRTLTAECLRLDGDDPAVIVHAGYSKRRRQDVQPISFTDAAWLRKWAATREGKTLFDVPWNAAKMLRRDLAVAGIPDKTAEGVVDFHSFRHTYISELVERGTDVKTAQELARHSTPELTIGRYSHTTEARKRAAVRPIDDIGATGEDHKPDRAVIEVHGDQSADTGLKVSPGDLELLEMQREVRALLSRIEARLSSRGRAIDSLDAHPRQGIDTVLFGKSYVPECPQLLCHEACELPSPRRVTPGDWWRLIAVPHVE